MNYENFLFPNCIPLPICCRSDPDAFGIPDAGGIRISGCDDHAIGFRVVRATGRR
jgi:hypothetical protein